MTPGAVGGPASAPAVKPPPPLQPGQTRWLFGFVENGRCGFIDSKGKVVIRPHYKARHCFRRSFRSDGLVPVLQKRRVGYMDGTGRLVIPFATGQPALLSEGLLATLDPATRKFGYMDRRGKMVIAARFKRATGFQKGLAVVRGRSKNRRKLRLGKVGYIDRAGSWVIKPRFGNGRRFSGGLAPVAVGRKWGFIDKRGKIVIPTRYTDARSFEHGLARVSVNNEWRYIDRTGRTIWQPASAHVAGQQVSFTNLAVGGNARPPKRQFLVLRDSAGLRRQWEIAYRNHGRKPPVPVVDFQKYDVLAIYQGAKPSTGYSVRVSSVVDSGRRITVVVKEWTPSGGCMTGSMMTNAWHMVRVDRKNKPYSFTTRQLDSCSRRRR